MCLVLDVGDPHFQSQAALKPFPWLEELSRFGTLNIASTASATNHSFGNVSSEFLLSLLQFLFTIHLSRDYTLAQMSATTPTFPVSLGVTTYMCRVP